MDIFRILPMISASPDASHSDTNPKRQRGSRQVSRSRFELVRAERRRIVFTVAFELHAP